MVRKCFLMANMMKTWRRSIMLCGMIEVAAVLWCRGGQQICKSWRTALRVEVFILLREESVQSHHLSPMSVQWRGFHQICKLHEMERVSWHAWSQNCCPEGPIQEPWESQKGQMPSCPWKIGISGYRLRPYGFESSSAEKGLWILLNRS